MLTSSQKYNLGKYKHIRFIGAGGIGMSALIHLIEEQKAHGQLNSDLTISQSDNAWSAEKNGELSDDIDLAVVSTAIPQTDRELVELKSRSIEIWHRSDMLFALSQSQEQKSIVVTGTHGKTSSSSMLAHLLMDQKLDPSFIIGGILLDYKTNGHAGKGKYFVLEGDESDKSFLKTKPSIALINAVEADHLENYPGGLDEIIKSFSDFAASSEKLVICIDSENNRQILTNAKLAAEDILTFSNQDKNADLYIKDKDLFFKEELIGSLDLKSFGGYNYLNAIGVIGASYFAGVEIKSAIESLKNFRGTKRRLEHVGDFDFAGKKVTVYDDYAHHPTEIRALMAGALAEAKAKYKRLVFVYQPHHPIRTRDFWDDFVAAFKDFPDGHKALLCDIYVARSGHIDGINSERMAQEIANPNLKYMPFADARFDANDKAVFAKIRDQIVAELEDGDLLLLVGAGNISKVAEAF